MVADEGEAVAYYANRSSFLQIGSDISAKGAVTELE